MSVLEKLFQEERKISDAVRQIGALVLELSDFTTAKSPLELAHSQIIGKKMRQECDKINEEIHIARKLIGRLMTEKTKVKFKKQERELHELENDLALMHGDVQTLGSLAEHFFEAKDRKAAFQNLNKAYSELMGHVLALVVEEQGLSA
jgi:hypothetical protein